MPFYFSIKLVIWGENLGKIEKFLMPNCEVLIEMLVSDLSNFGIGELLVERVF